MLETAFTLLGTPVTWLEVLAFVLALANIACNVWEIHWGWPLTIVASALYAWLFYASSLYGEGSVNLFFALTAVWGWWQWLRGHRANSDEPLHVEKLDAAGLKKAGVAVKAVGYTQGQTDLTAPLTAAGATTADFVAPYGSASDCVNQAKALQQLGITDSRKIMTAPLCLSPQVIAAPR